MFKNNILVLIYQMTLATVVLIMCRLIQIFTLDGKFYYWLLGSVVLYSYYFLALKLEAQNSLIKNLISIGSLLILTVLSLLFKDSYINYILFPYLPFGVFWQGDFIIERIMMVVSIIIVLLTLHSHEHTIVNKIILLTLTLGIIIFGVVVKLNPDN